MGKEIELLEYHAGAGEDFPGLSLTNILGCSFTVVFSQHPALDFDSTGINFLQAVDAAEHGALAGAGRPDNCQHIALYHGEVNALQHLQLPETLVDAAHLQHNLRGCPGSVFHIHVVIHHILHNAPPAS